MLSVRVAAALARTLPRRAGFVSMPLFLLFIWGPPMPETVLLILMERSCGVSALRAAAFAPEDTGPFTGGIKQS